MPIHAIDTLPAGDFRTGTIGLWPSADNHRTVNVATVRSSLPGSQRNNATLVAAAVQKSLQDLFDVRIPRASLPLDDPDLLSDPARPNLFWDGTDLVGRSVKVTLTWNATASRWRLVLEALVS